MQELSCQNLCFGVSGWRTHFKSSCDALFRRSLNLFLNPFLMLVYDFLVETENSDGAGSDGMGGGADIDFLVFCAWY